jgi:hypothetical protein
MRYLNTVLFEYGLKPVKAPRPPERTQIADRLADLERRWAIERTTKDTEQETKDHESQRTD